MSNNLINPFSRFYGVLTRGLFAFSSHTHASEIIAAETVRSEMYSDNVLSGAHLLEEALLKQDELNLLFNQGLLNLRKWSSKNAEVLFCLLSIC